jgi:AraC family transcriptional regulator
MFLSLSVYVLRPLQVPGKSTRVTALTQLFAAHLVEGYTDAALRKPDFRGGAADSAAAQSGRPRARAPLGRHLYKGVGQVAGTELLSLLSGVQTNKGMSPLQFVRRERISRAQQLIRETARSLIEIGLEVGYKSPSHFARVFRQLVG